MNQAENENNRIDMWDDKNEEMFNKKRKASTYDVFIENNACFCALTNQFDL